MSEVCQMPLQTFSTHTVKECLIVALFNPRMRYRIRENLALKEMLQFKIPLLRVLIISSLPISWGHISQIEKGCALRKRKSTPIQFV